MSSLRIALARVAPAAALLAALSGAAGFRW